MIRRDESMTSCVWSHRTPSRRYPEIQIGGKHLRESRFIWEEAHGQIPEGMFVCHRCDNPRCIRLDHLFLGSPLDNAEDMMKKGRHFGVRKTECAHGHPFDEANTMYRSDGRRFCRECNRLRKYGSLENPPVERKRRSWVTRAVEARRG
jgi:HNH endonuclease